MGFVTAADPASKTVRAFTDEIEFTDAMERLHFIPLRSDNTPFLVHFIADEGGYLLDGAPLNVWFDGVWYEGQLPVAQKYWGKNGVPTPSQAILSLPVVPMPSDTAQIYESFKEQQGAGGLLSSGNVMLLAGAGLILLMATSVGGGGRSKQRSVDYGV